MSLSIFRFYEIEGIGVIVLYVSRIIFRLYITRKIAFVLILHTEKTLPGTEGS